MSIYIHIPFCTQICSYCDFCKLYKNEKWIDKYLKALENEIKQNYQGEIIKTLYIGGGTPSALSLNELKKLFKIIQIFKLDKNAEITFETNTEDLTLEKINFLKTKINRLSIGLQTFNKNYLKTLNRKINIENLKYAFQNFDNINIDLMYGFQNQTEKDVEKDLEKIIKLNPKHISAYCLILEPNTKLYIENYKPLDDDKERKIYDKITNILEKQGYLKYELSNFSYPNYESKHNLVYWNNQNYYGFGLGASGYLKNERYENTKSLTEYLKGNYILNKYSLTKDEIIQNEFILGFRKIKGINKKNFQKKYQININNLQIIKELLNQKLLKENKDNIYINPKYLYTSNEILLKFIDFSLHKH